MGVSYIAATQVVADCGETSKTFKPGDSLDGVLPGTLDSMIRMGQAVEAKTKVAPNPAPKKKEVKDG